MKFVAVCVGVIAAADGQPMGMPGWIPGFVTSFITTTPTPLITTELVTTPTPLITTELITTTPTPIITTELVTTHTVNNSIPISASTLTASVVPSTPSWSDWIPSTPLTGPQATPPHGGAHSTQSTPSWSDWIPSTPLTGPQASPPNGGTNDDMITIPAATHTLPTTPPNGGTNDDMITIPAATHTLPTTPPNGGTNDDMITIPAATHTLPTTPPNGGTNDDMVTIAPVVELIRVDKGRVIQSLKKRCGGLICSTEFGCQPIMCDEREGEYTKTLIQSTDAGLSCAYWNRLFECQGSVTISAFECEIHHPCRTLPAPGSPSIITPIKASQIGILPDLNVTLPAVPTFPIPSTPVASRMPRISSK